MANEPDMNAEQGGIVPESSSPPEDTGSAEATDQHQPAFGEAPPGIPVSKKGKIGIGVDKTYPDRSDDSIDESKLKQARQELQFDSRGNFVLTSATAGGPSVSDDPKTEDILYAQVPGRPAGRRGAAGSTGATGGRNPLGGIRGRVAAIVTGLGIVLGGSAAYVANQSANTGSDGPNGAPTQTDPEVIPGGEKTAIPAASETPAVSPIATEPATPVETQEPKPPVYERENYPYELAFKNVYEGDEVTIVLGADKSAYERAEDNMCKENIQKNPRTYECPPIRKFELSDEYLKQYAPDKFSNGMSKEEMVQRMNDFELSLIVWNMNQKTVSKDMTVERLKDMIHKGTAPDFVQGFADGSSMSWDLNKNNKYEVHYIALGEPPERGSNVKAPYTASLVEYEKIDNARIVGIFNAESFLQNYKEPPGHVATIGGTAVILEANVMVSYDKFPLSETTILADIAGGNAMVEGVDRLGIVVVSK